MPELEGQAGELAEGVLAIPLLRQRLAESEAVRDLEYRPEILALAEELAADSDCLGIETTRLEFLLRAVLFLDRSWRF